MSLTQFIVLKLRLMQLWGYYVVLTTTVDDHFDPLFVNPHCDATITIVEGEHRFFTLVIWAVFKTVCARFRIQAADFHGWFLFFSFLAFPLVSCGLWTANPLQVSDFFALITPWTWSRHIGQEHVRLFHHICSSWKFLLVIPEKHARGRSGSGFLWCLETAIALLARPFLHSAQFSRFLPGQGLLAGAVSTLRFGKSTSRQFGLLSSLPKCQSRRILPAIEGSSGTRRTTRLLSVLSTWICSVLLPRSVSGQSIHSRRSWLLWGSCVRQGACVENAFHCGAKAIQHRSSLNCILLFQ